MNTATIIWTPINEDWRTSKPQHPFFTNDDLRWLQIEAAESARETFAGYEEEGHGIGSSDINCVTREVISAALRAGRLQNILDERNDYGIIKAGFMAINGMVCDAI